jgi:hypothetical protein
MADPDIPAAELPRHRSDIQERGMGRYLDQCFAIVVVHTGSNRVQHSTYGDLVPAGLSFSLAALILFRHSPAARAASLSSREIAASIRKKARNV